MNETIFTMQTSQKRNNIITKKRKIISLMFSAKLVKLIQQKILQVQLSSIVNCKWYSLKQSGCKPTLQASQEYREVPKHPGFAHRLWVSFTIQ